MLSRPLRLTALLVALLIAVYDLLALLIQTMGDGDRGAAPEFWIGASAITSFVAAVWIGLESFAALLIPRRSAGATPLPPGALLAARLAVVSFSLLVPIGYAVGDPTMAGRDVVLVTAIYGAIAALPLLTAVWALRTAMREPHP